MARPSGLALLLSRLGARVSADFASGVGELGLTPAQVGVMRVIGQHPGLSQQDLAGRIGSVPSRVTKLVDELEELGLVQRARSTTDRRHVELLMAPGAADRVAAVRGVVASHDASLVKALTRDELATLLRLLGKVADALGETSEGHPGYGR